MTKTLPLKQQFMTWAEDSVFSSVKHSLIIDLVVDYTQILSHWLKRNINNGVSTWGVVSIGVVALFVWNWELLMALCISAGVALMVYQGFQIPLLAANSRRLIRTLLDSPLLVALTTGLISLLISYSTLVIWQDTGRWSIALAVLLQGGCTISALGIMVWQLIKPVATAQEDLYDLWVTQLTSTDTLKRLIAVRRLSQIEILAVSRRQELSEYFQVLLAQEPQPQVREAIVIGLKHLNLQSFNRSKASSHSRKDIPQRQSLQIKRRNKVRKEQVYAELEVHPEESWVQ